MFWIKLLLPICVEHELYGNMCRIATAWAGDSRMVLGRQRSNEDGQSFLEAVELTEDHKPDNPGECRRINEAGGRVDRLVSGTGVTSR